MNTELVFRMFAGYAAIEEIEQRAVVPLEMPF